MPIILTCSRMAGRLLVATSSRPSRSMEPGRLLLLSGADYDQEDSRNGPVLARSDCCNQTECGHTSDLWSLLHKAPVHVRVLKQGSPVPMRYSSPLY